MLKTAWLGQGDPRCPTSQLRAFSLSSLPSLHLFTHPQLLPIGLSFTVTHPMKLAGDKVLHWLTLAKPGDKTKPLGKVERGSGSGQPVLLINLCWHPVLTGRTSQAQPWGSRPLGVGQGQRPLELGRE